MGADLYIESIFDAAFDQYQPLYKKWIEHRNELSRQGKTAEARIADTRAREYYNLMHEKGYFRDSYNSSNLLWMLDLSWWEDVGSLLEHKADGSYMSPENAKQFLHWLEERKDVFEHNLMTCTPWKGWTKEAFEKYFRDSYQELKDFLNRAIQLQEPILCSI